MPALVLDLLVVAVAATVITGRPTIAVVAFALLGALAVLRASRMLLHLDRAQAVDVPRALVVASVYDLARALAPMLHADHHNRRQRSEG